MAVDIASSRVPGDQKLFRGGVTIGIFSTIDFGFSSSKTRKPILRRKWNANEFVQSIIVLAFLLVAGVSGVNAQQQAPPSPSKFKLTSPAYADGAQIPTQYSCA